jgi:alkanesulfonate monooxygenase SsuD/methylene tetrahydromethanopterin reductase-like flavin-dependent oxidoreductase (luciferase family)
LAHECGRLGAPLLTARLPVARAVERLALYEAGLAESGLDGETQRRLRHEAALWRFVYVAESQAQAEDELGAALLETRRHMVHARAIHNPPDFHVPSARVNPWNDPAVSHEDGARYSLQHSAIYGTAERVAEQVAELRDAGIHHVLCQMSTGYLDHAKVMDSTRRFGDAVIPKFRKEVSSWA